eukprot:g34947.t1
MPLVGRVTTGGSPPLSSWKGQWIVLMPMPHVKDSILSRIPSDNQPKIQQNVSDRLMNEIEARSRQVELRLVSPLPSISEEDLRQFQPIDASATAKESVDGWFVCFSVPGQIQEFCKVYASAKGNSIPYHSEGYE